MFENWKDSGLSLDGIKLFYHYKLTWYSRIVVQCGSDQLIFDFHVILIHAQHYNKRNDTNGIHTTRLFIHDLACLDSQCDSSRSVEWTHGLSTRTNSRQINKLLWQLTTLEQKGNFDSSAIATIVSMRFHFLHDFRSWYS